MNAKQKLHQVRLQEWAGRFAKQQASGLTVRQWCEQNHLSFHTYNYWKHLLREEVVDQVLPDIVPLTATSVFEPASSLEMTGSSFRADCTIRANDSTLKLFVDGFSIEVDSSVSEEVLGRLLKAVRYAQGR